MVVLARRLYFEGNCVVIDHGLGLFTISMHLSRIRVHEGQHVAAGQLLGLSGATGRVTGPHLHWAVRWQGAYLDPAKLLRMNFSALNLQKHCRLVWTRSKKRSFQFGSLANRSALALERFLFRCFWARPQTRAPASLRAAL